MDVQVHDWDKAVMFDPSAKNTAKINYLPLGWNLENGLKGVKTKAEAKIETLRSSPKLQFKTFSGLFTNRSIEGYMIISVIFLPTTANGQVKWMSWNWWILPTSY